MKKQFVDAKELKLQEAVGDEHSRHMNVTLAEARVASSLSLRGYNAIQLYLHASTAPPRLRLYRSNISGILIWWTLQLSTLTLPLHKMSQLAFKFTIAYKHSTVFGHLLITKNRHAIVNLLNGL
ncbi:hypothetical protein YC2023_008034 [Brassica napus]